MKKIGEVVCSSRTWVQATIPTAAEEDCVICKATRPWYWFESEHEPGRVWLRNLRETHQRLPSSQIFSSCSCSTGLTRLFQTAQLFRPIFQVHVCCYVKPFGMLFGRDVFLLHECHRSLNILFFRDPLPLSDSEPPCLPLLVCLQPTPPRPLYPVPICS